MDFLEAAQHVVRECGISDDVLLDVNVQTGDYGRVVNWIKQRDLKIQTLFPNWLFMRKPFSFLTVQDQAEYDGSVVVGSDFQDWRRCSFRLYDTAGGLAGEVELTDFVDYNEFRDIYLSGNYQVVRSRPTVCSVTPDHKLVLAATPDATSYTIRGEYYRKPTQMAINTDKPGFPEEFHFLVVYGSMMDYGGYEAAPEVYNRGKEEYNSMLARLKAKYLESVMPGFPLA